MPARQSILLLILSVLITLPAGVASAEIDVQNGNRRVRISDDGGIRIDRFDRGSITVNRNDEDDEDDDDYSSPPYRYPRSIRVRTPQQSRIQQRLQQRLRSLKYPRTTRSIQSSCRGRSVAQQRTITSSSGTGSNRTYSSTTTTICR